MARCDYYRKEMMNEDSCTPHAYYSKDENRNYAAVPYYLRYPDAQGVPTRCHDCNVKVGGYHHPGCDEERCPRCGRQLISCDCVLEPVRI